LRYILLILIFWSHFSFSQDTIRIPESELNKFFIALDELREQDSIKTVLIKDLEYQIFNYKLLEVKDSLILDYKNEEIGLLTEQIELYDKRLKQVDRWWKKPWIGYITGIASNIITIHILDYTLPQ